MKIIAQNASKQYLVQMTENELLAIVFGSETAEYNKDTSESAKQFLKNCVAGTAEAQVSEILKRGMEFINNPINEDGYNTIKGKLQAMVNNIDHIERLRLSLIEPVSPKASE
jgi:hypothetical protein